MKKINIIWFNGKNSRVNAGFILSLVILLVITSSSTVSEEPVIKSIVGRGPNYNVVDNLDGTKSAIFYKDILNIKNDLGEHVPFEEFVDISISNGNLVMSRGDKYSVSFMPIFEMQNGNQYYWEDIPIGVEKNLWKETHLGKYKYGVDFNFVPDNIKNKLQYLILHRTDSSGLTWDDIRIEDNSIIIKDKIKFSYDDILRKFTIISINKTDIVIGNLANNFIDNGDGTWNISFDPEIDTYSTAQTATWTAPAGVTSVKVECWGSGASGGGEHLFQDGGGGGGGGAYSRLNSQAVTAGLDYPIKVGAGAASGAIGQNGISGDESWFNDTDDSNLLLAKGGIRGLRSTGTPPSPGGAGGLASEGLGDVKYDGGTGGTGRDNDAGRGGPGGSSAGNASAGTDGPDPWTTATAGAAPEAGGKGGNGGNAAGQNGFPGAAPGGGGGGGAEDSGGDTVGGTGADGKCILTYTPTADETSPTHTDFITNCTNSTKKGETIYWGAEFTDETTAGQYWLMYSQDVVSGSAWTNTTNYGYVDGANMTYNLTITSARGKDINGTFFFNDLAGNIAQTTYLGCTINNTQPDTSGQPSINNTSPITGNHLNCSKIGLTYSDVDGDTEGTSLYTWFNQSQGTGDWELMTGETSTVLDTVNMKTKDKVKCGIIVYDGIDYDDNRINSSAITLSNIPPTHTTPSISTPSGNNLNTENVTCVNQSTFDSDGDAVTNIYNWYKNGTSITTLNIPFDTNTTSTTKGAVKDYSGYNNNGTIGDINLWDKDCIFGGCYDFDGTDDYINISHDKSIDIDEDVDFSITLWFKLNKTGKNHTLVSKLSSESGCTGSPSVCSTHDASETDCGTAGCTWDTADCYGSPSACGYGDEGQCTTCGCDWDVANCYGAGGVCGDLGGASCSSCSGCTWYGTPDFFCDGGSISCTFETQADCEGCDGVGCAWDIANCEGTADACSTQGQADCTDCGCAWDTANCEGTADACSTHSTQGDCATSGCSWTSDENGYRLDINESNHLTFFLGNSTSNINVPSANDLKSDVWYFLTVSIDGSGNTVLYVNSTLEGAVATSGAGASSNSETLILGATRNDSNNFNYLDGRIDELKMFNHSLSTDQIYQYYIEGLNGYTNSTITASETNPLSNWTCYITPNDAFNDGIILNSVLMTINLSAPPSGDSCTYTSGDWNIDCSDNCVISSEVDLNGNNIYTSGKGDLIINAPITNYKHVALYCNTICDGGCFEG